MLMDHMVVSVRLVSDKLHYSIHYVNDFAYDQVHMLSDIETMSPKVQVHILKSYWSIQNSYIQDL